jgi:two-component system chemotaxis sensor kinase CheA
VVATDKTVEFETQRALEIERQYAAMVVKYMKNKDQFLRFLSTVGPTLDRVIEMGRRGLSAADVNEAFRALHTIEGEAGAFSLRELRLASRECQQTLEPWRGGDLAPDAATGVRLVETCAEMRAQFDAFLKQNSDIIQIPDGDVGRSVEVPVRTVRDLLAQVERLPGGPELAARFGDTLLSEPIGDHLRYFDGLMATVAERLGKQVNPLVVTGGGLRINPDEYKDFFASMVHLFRNAVDHGLETPLEREWAGKPPAGTVRAEIQADATFLKLTVSDDGRGIDPAAMRLVLRKKFPLEDPDLLSDHDVIQSVCRPGFSSRDEVGEFSGRGVGLDALREEVLRLGGTLVVKSKVNEGTAIEVTLPLVGRAAVLLKGA